jgi:hypothetical protein
MPIDASIPLQARGVQLDNPLEVQGRALQLRNLATQQQTQQMAMEQAQRTQQQEAQLNDLYRGNVNPDGTVNRQGLVQGAAQAGLGSRIPGIQKGLLEADKAQADVGHVGAQTSKLQFETAKAKLDMSGAALNSLLSRPDVTHDDVLQTITSLVQQGVVAPDQGAQMARSMPGNPAQLRPFLMQKGLEVMDASKRMDLLTPKTSIQNMGGSDQVFSTNQLTGQVTPGQSFARSQSPDSIANNATAMRGQNMVDSRSREATAATMGKPFEVTGPDGQPMLVQQDRSGKITPVQGFGPKAGAATLNKEQSDALTFGSRMKVADKIMQDMAAQGVDRGSVIKGALESVPLVGGALGGVANATVASDKQQQVEQAQRDFVNAVLRRESGAAISSGEFDSAAKQYFPRVGDSAAVIQQKAQNRQLATRGLMAAVPASQRNLLDTAAAAPGGVPADIAAILSKHGGGK